MTEEGPSKVSDGDALDRALAAYDGILRCVGERAGEISPRPVASHWPHLGSAYRAGGLFLVGQALEGWDADDCEARWPAERCRTAAGRSEIVAATRAWHSGAVEPIWEVVRDGDRRGSPFWTMARKIVDALAPGPEPWYARLAWGNTYPLCHERFGDRRAQSPTGALKEAEDPFVGQLLLALVDHLQPGIVVVVAGPTYWWGVRQRALPPFEPRPLPLIASQLVDERPWVVGYHPRYTRQRRIPDDAYLRCLVTEAASLQDRAASQGGPRTLRDR